MVHSNSLQCQFGNKHMMERKGIDRWQVVISYWSCTGENLRGFVKGILISPPPLFLLSLPWIPQCPLPFPSFSALHPPAILPLSVPLSSASSLSFALATCTWKTYVSVGEPQELGGREHLISPVSLSPQCFLFPSSWQPSEPQLASFSPSPTNICLLSPIFSYIFYL